MTDVHRRTSSSSRLSPEEIINRGFASAFRGVSETEVRNFLRRVADDLSAMRAREVELNHQIEELQERLANPPPVTEQQLLEALGEETARVLRSAQDAAEDMRKRAEERAAERVAEAKEAAERIRQEAEQQAATRTEVAERRAAELEKEAETRATQERESAESAATELRETTTRETDAIREQAEQAAAAEVETAKATSHGMVEEASAVRERVLSDLARRRSLLQAQVDELRSGRDRLLDAYRVVKHTLGDATVALAQVEARANAELAAPPPRISVPPVEGELEVLQSTGDDGDVEIDLEGESVVVIDEANLGGGPAPGGPATGGGTPDAEDSGAAVDALFARLRASHTVDPVPGVALPEPAPEADAATSPKPESSKPESSKPESSKPAAKPEAPATTAGPAKTEAKSDAPAKPEPPKGSPAKSDAPAKPEPPKGSPAKSDAPAKPEPPKGSPAKSDAPAKPEPPKAAPKKPEKSEKSEKPAPAAKDEPSKPDASDDTPKGDDALRVARGEVLGPLTAKLLRGAKRALQDQQNEVLAQIRTVKGKVESATVLPAVDAQEVAWAAVLREPLTEAYVQSYQATAAPGRSTKPELPAELIDDLAQTMVESWRKRLVTAVDGAGDDRDAMTQRLGARYREYRGRELDAALGDAIAAVWARGTFDAVPDGTLLRWIPAEVGRCPDCDDNALETTARSEPFPTGQRFPPAHPGCRCFLVRAEPDRQSR